MSGKPTVISLFSGVGGSSLGYQWAGFKELLAIDFDNHAVECFKLNFLDVPVWQRSVVDITGKEILEFCNIKQGELDVLDGSPPCQGFSTAGKRIVRDPRNDLFKHYCRLVTELQPKVFVMENVSGMAKGKMKGRFIEILNKLKNTGYKVKCKQMNTKYYGVPQSRERLIFIGTKTYTPIFPQPSNNIITVNKALIDLENIGPIFKPTAPKVLALMGKMKEGTCGTDLYGVTTGFQMLKINRFKPCPTVTKTCTGTWFSGMLHPTENRYLTINELKRLCSFPDTWMLTGTFQKQWARLGNAVMPKFMQAIAETIKREILAR